MFRYSTLTAVVVALGLAGALAQAGEPKKPPSPTDRAPTDVRAFERELGANPKLAKRVAEAARSGDKQVLLKLINPFVPTADINSLTIDQPSAQHARVIKIKIVVKGGNSGEVNVPINP